MADTEDEKYHGEAVPAQSEDFTRISDEVVSTIAGIELNKIEGVHPVGGGITDFLGRKNPSKGIKIEADGDQIALEKLELTAAVHKLPAKYREIVALYYYEDLTIAEIAGILAASEGTVKNRLHRARQKLAKLLREGESDEFQAKTTS